MSNIDDLKKKLNILVKSAKAYSISDTELNFDKFINDLEAFDNKMIDLGNVHESSEDTLDIPAIINQNIKVLRQMGQDEMVQQLKDVEKMVK
jgi:hypothetical protein